jgi:hypothetical protein
MTVKQLIQILNSIEDQNTTVMVRGYERGVSDIQDPAIENIALDVNEEWYYGRHEIQNFDHEYKDKQIVQAIILTGHNASMGSK